MTQLTLVDIPNILLPGDNSRQSVSFKQGLSLADLFPAVLGESTRWVYTMDGKVCEDLALELPRQGSIVTRSPMPEGGGGGGNSGSKQILRIVALIAVIILSQGAGSYMAGTFGLSASTWTAIAVVGGSLVVNSVMPPPSSSLGSSSDDSASYGIDGAKNTSAEGVVVPLIYGTFRYGGNIIDNYVVNDGQTQYLYMLIAAGEGPIASITDIVINDQPWTVYEDAELETTYLGQSDQGVMPWFADTIVPNSIQLELDQVVWRQYTTNTAVDKIRVDILAPNGFYQTFNDGSTGSVGVNVAIQYKKTGSPTWLPFPCSNSVDLYQDVITYNQVPDIDGDGNPTGTYHDYVPTGLEIWDGDTLLLPSGASDGQATVVGSRTHVAVYNGTGIFLVEAAQRAPYRRSFMSTQLDNGAYDIRVKRNSPESTESNQSDVLYVSDINEITIADIGYVNTALLGVKIKLSDQLNGMPTVTHMNGGKLVRCWNSTGAAWEMKSSANPAWISLDILTNKRYGGGVALSRIDLDAWKDWAAWCDAQGFEFHGVFDTDSNIWDAATAVMRCGRAALFAVGTRYSVNIERDASPTMLFSSANMVTGTFKENWLPLAERANEINITFPDKDNDYKQRVMKLYDPLVVATGVPTRVANISIMGVVDKQRAYDEMVLQLNLNRLITRTISFSALIEAIACSVGDNVLVSHDMPSWGDSGRVDVLGTATTVTLDHTVNMTADKAYACLLIFDSVQRTSGTGVASVIGQNITLNGYVTVDTSIKRLVIQGLDFEVVESFNAAGGKHGLTVVGDCSMVTVGTNAWKAYDTNVLVTRNVVNTPGDQSVLTVTSAFPTNPQRFQKWLFGEINKTGKPFKITKISGTHEYNRDIEAVEFDAAAYSGMLDAPDINYSDLDAGVVQPVTIDAVNEQQVLTGVVYVTQVTVAWHSLQPTYLTADVWVSINGGTFAMVGSDPASYTMPANKGNVLIFRIVARDRQGRMQPISNAPVVTYTVQGRTTAPGSVTGLTVTPNDSGLYVTWNRPVEPDWSFTTIKLDGANYAAATQLFQDKLTSFSTKFLATGAHTFRAKNTIPEYESVAEADVTYTVVAPHAIVFGTPEINNGSVALSWTSAKMTQPLGRHIVRKGLTTDAYASLPDWAILPGSALSATVIFPVAGTYRVWVVAEDAFGNQGTPSFKDVVVTVFGVVADPTPPPVPTGVALTPGYDSVFFTWSTPTFTQGHGYSAMIVWGATQVPGNLPVFTDAVLIGTFDGTAGYDPIGPGLKRRYWFAYRSIDGVVGARLGGTNGIAAETGTDVTAVLATLEGAITQDQLYVDLSTKIDLSTLNGPNMCPNSGFLPAAAGWYGSTLLPRGNGQVPLGAPSDYVASYGGRDSYTVVGTTVAKVIMPVSVGEVLDVSCWMASKVATTAVASLQLIFINADGVTQTAYMQVATAAAGLTAWRQFTGSITIPAGTRYVQPDLFIDQDPNSGTNVVLWAQPMVTRRAGTGTAAFAAIATETTARTTADTAIASSVTTLTTTVGNNTTSIQSLISTTNGLNAQYTVKIDSNGYVSGFGLASTANNGVPTSSFIIRADKFSIASPTGPGIPPKIPFYVVTTAFVQNGQTVQPGVYMDDAFIANGTIVSAMIGTAAITSAQIGDLSVTTAKIGNLQVGTQQITGNAVTMPVSVYSAGSIGLASGGTIAATIVINCTGALVEIFGGCSVATSFNSYTVSGSQQFDDSTYTADVLRDGNLLYSFSGLMTMAENRQFSGILTIPPVQDNPGAGQHTYQLRVAGDSIHNNHNASNRSLFVIEVKK